MTIRKFGERFMLQQLCDRGSVPAGIVGLLVNAIHSRRGSKQADPHGSFDHEHALP